MLVHILKLDTPRRNTRIAIVECMPELTHVYKKFLEAAGLKVIATFSKANELLDFYNANPSTFGNPGEAGQDSPIFVLLDCRMSEIDCAKEAMRKLRDMNPNLKIILTTVKDPSTLEIDEKLFDAKIRKPFTTSELLGTIDRLSSPMRTRGTIILDDPREMNEVLSEILSDSKEKMCSCRSSYGVVRLVDVPEYRPMYVRAGAKGLQVLLITEITRANLFYCKQLMVNQGVQLRHLDGVLTNFSVWDEKHSFEAVQSSDDSSVVKQLLYTNLEPIVRRNQYLFDKLWSIAVPAEKKISELEFSSDPTKIRVMTGPDEIAQARVRMIRNTRSTLDGCTVPHLISGFLIPRLGREYVRAISRGVKCRQITEITKESLSSCKNLIEMGMEVRHLPNLRGAFSLSERQFMATMTLEDTNANQPLSAIDSSHPEFVEQNRAIFNTLWSVAIPASIRIKEIEEAENAPIPCSNNKDNLTEI